MAAAVASDAAQAHLFLAGRRYLYTLFHKTFGGVANEGLLKSACGTETLQALRLFSEGDDRLGRVADFLESLANADEVSLLDSIKDEYTRMFVGPAQLVAYPWEAPYVTHKAAACQESTLLVREAYRLQGLAPRKLLRVPDDHVSIMCAFLAELGDRSLLLMRPLRRAELAQILRVQQAFVAKHLLDWVDEYAVAARRSKTAVFYPQMIEAFSDFAKVDALFLSEASFWAESLEDASFNFEDALGDSIAHAADGLSGLALFGIEDNELVSV